MANAAEEKAATARQPCRALGGYGGNRGAQQEIALAVAGMSKKFGNGFGYREPIIAIYARAKPASSCLLCWLNARRAKSSCAESYVEPCIILRARAGRLSLAAFDHGGCGIY